MIIPSCEMLRFVRSTSILRRQLRCSLDLVVLRVHGSVSSSTILNYVKKQRRQILECFGILDVFLNYVIVNVHNSTTMLKWSVKLESDEVWSWNQTTKTTTPGDSCPTNMYVFLQETLCVGMCEDENCAQYAKNCVQYVKNCAQYAKNCAQYVKSCVQYMKNCVQCAKNCVKCVKDCVKCEKDCVKCVKDC